MDIDEEQKDSESVRFATIENPIASCDQHEPAKNHTTFRMVALGPNGNPQRASGKVLFTYDVKWTENKEVPWASHVGRPT